jgi:glycosyltransferase involved in cell wall biosynthesis
LYRYGLKTAHRIIVQTRKQQAMLREDFGYDSLVLSMPCPGPSEQEYVGCEQQRNGSRRVLWIGRICEQKRPDRLLDLAAACPDLEFDLVGPSTDTAYCRCVCERAKTLRNVAMHGAVPRDRVPDFYREAAALCCTSDFEGFPNTFLEAWSYGLPIVSTFDPDNIILEKGLGRVAKDVAELALGIRSLLDSPDRWRDASRAAREYYVQNHAMDKAMQQFERVFREVTGLVGNKGFGDCT